MNYQHALALIAESRRFRAEMQEKIDAAEAANRRRDTVSYYVYVAMLRDKYAPTMNELTNRIEEAINEYGTV